MLLNHIANNNYYDENKSAAGMHDTPAEKLTNFLYKSKELNLDLTFIKAYTKYHCLYT